MLKVRRDFARRSILRGRLAPAMVGGIAAIVAIVLAAGTLSAQRGQRGGGRGAAPAAAESSGYAHLNPAIEKLAKGEPMIGTQTDDMSLQNCHAMARLNYDYVYVDMEHGPLNLDGLAFCRAAMVDKAWAIKNGAKEKVALFARFPPY